MIQFRYYYICYKIKSIGKFLRSKQMALTSNSMNSCIIHTVLPSRWYKYLVIGRDSIQLFHACSGNSQNYCPEVLEMTWELFPSHLQHRRPKATVPKSSPAPRDNSFDCSLNWHDITVLLSYIHAQIHHWCAWQEWRTAHHSRAWNSSGPEVGEQSTVSLRLLFSKFSCNQLKI